MSWAFERGEQAAAVFQPAVECRSRMSRFTKKRTSDILYTTVPESHFVKENEHERNNGADYPQTA